MRAAMPPGGVKELSARIFASAKYTSLNLFMPEGTSEGGVITALSFIVNVVVEPYTYTPPPLGLGPSAVQPVMLLPLILNVEFVSTYTPPP